jgi:hypothetical protein
MMRNLKSGRIVALVLLASIPVLALACSGGDENPQPGGGGSTSTTSQTTTQSGSTTSDTQSGSTTTTTSSTTGAGGCFSGTPTTNDELLDACNGLTCQAFDNKGRLPLLHADGTLPPLP